VVALAGLGAGCGGQTASSTGGGGTSDAGSAATHAGGAGVHGAYASVSASSPARAARTPVSRAQAVALAHAINLRAADVPGMAPIESEGTGHEGTGVKLEECAGVRGLKRDETASVKSPLFGVEAAGEKTTVRSSVTVWKTAAAAAREVNILQNAHTRACVAQIFDASAARAKLTGARVGHPTFSWASGRLSGTQGSVALRITVPYTSLSTGATVDGYFDIFEYVDGPVDIGLTARSEISPIPSSTENRLLTLLLDRSGALAP
jgi:hypothetical protein